MKQDGRAGTLTYRIVFVMILAVEILIALFVHDAIVRPYIGDVLVIFLLYAFVRGIVKKPVRFLPLYLFFFALAVEVSQYFHLVYRLHLQNSKVMTTILGTSYSTIDILCYLAATVILVLWERMENKIHKDVEGA